jgi:hypothetical protein
MSIYATILSLDEDEPEDGGAPFVYRTSVVTPTMDCARAGWFDVARIREEVDGVGDAWREFLRIGVCGEGDEQQTVLLNRRQVDAVVEAMSGWLEQTGGGAT